MVRLERGKNYARFNDCIYEDGYKIIKLHDKFINIPRLKDNVIDYMNKFLNMFPDRAGVMASKTPMIKKIFFDCETTGLDPKLHAIHQLSGQIEIDDKVVHHFDFKIRPLEGALIEPDALAVSGTTEAMIMKYPPAEEVYKKFKVLLSTYCDRFDKEDKMWLIGFNSRDFDEKFLRVFFEFHKDPYFNAWFWPDSQDVMMLASSYLEKRRHKMSSFQLHRVAKELGLLVDDSKLHNGQYDVGLTRDIYRIVTGREIEL